MELSGVWSLYFSPSGTTRACADALADSFPVRARATDLLLADPGEGPPRPGELAIVSVPVFSGRVPPPCLEPLGRLQGAGTPAVAMVVYGNRDYDDALLELKTVLENQGFAVIGAAAVLARHSIFPRVAAGRPDRDDLSRLTTFGAQCAKKLEAFIPGRGLTLAVKGNRPYREIPSVPIKPTADKRCDGCGACARICPTRAIDPKSPRRTDRARCISCTACIAACPQKARRFRNPFYPLAAKAFLKKCAARREPEFFL